MKNLTRRDFLLKTAGVAGISALYPRGSFARPRLFVPDLQLLGVQAWVVREPLVEDFAGTLKKLAGMGYQYMEMCSPQGYAMAGFGPLQELSATEMKNIADDEGITINSCHYLFFELKAALQERIDYAKGLGLSQMTLSTFMLPGEATLDDWKQAADEFNQMGEQTASNAIQLVFHNHHFEFQELEGQLIYDMLLDRFDPELVKMQFQVAVIDRGYKAADYFKAHPGRFISAHLADWSAETASQVTLGKGVVDWPEFFDAVEVGGVKNCFVEIEMGADWSTFEDSAAFLKNL